MNAYFEQFVGDSKLDDIDKEYQDYFGRRALLGRNDEPLSIEAYIRVTDRWKTEYEKAWDDWGDRPGIPPIARELEWLLCV